MQLAEADQPIFHISVLELRNTELNLLFIEWARCEELWLVLIPLIEKMTALL